MKKKLVISHFIGAVLAAAMFTVYLVTMSVGAYPGESASLLTKQLGLMPRMSPSSPLYDLLSSLLVGASPALAISRLNFFSAFCGMLALWLLYDIVRNALLACIDEEYRDTTGATAAAILGGSAAALALGFCIPFWTVCTRASSTALDIFLLLAATRLFMVYMMFGSRWSLLLVSAVFGAGLTQFPTFLVFAPVFALVLLYFLWQKNDLRPGPIAAAAGCLLLGLSLYFYSAGSFYRSTGYTLREYQSYWHVFRIIFRDQYYFIARSLPTRGWLIILVVTVVPWITAMLIARRALNGERDWTYYGLHAIMTGLAVAVLLNARVAPWRVVEGRELLVTPYLLTAVLTGYLCAYWLRLPMVWWSERQEGFREALRHALGPLLALPLAAVIVIVPFLNFKECDARPAGDLNRIAADMVESLDGRPWLISDGSLDANLLLAASSKGIALKTIDVHAARSSVYMKYVATMFDSPRLKNLSEIGFSPMVEEWFRTEPQICQKVAVMGLPDLWDIAGYVAVPHHAFFLGREKGDVKPFDAAAILAEQRAWWERQMPRMERLAESRGSMGPLGQHLLRHASFVVNNLGVWLEDGNALAEAYEAYRLARRLHPPNVSALMNMNAMVKRGFRSDDSEKIRKDLENLVADKSTQQRLWNLSRYYGYVRIPEAFAEAGWNWALSGRRGIAVEGLQKALTIASDEKREPLKQLLADVYFMQKEGEKSESLYREILAGNPKNAGALMGLGRLETGKGNLDAAQSLFRQAEEAGAPAWEAALGIATVARLRGDKEDARRQVVKLLEQKPEFARGWVALASFALEDNDESAIQECLTRLNELPDGRGDAAAIGAEMALRRHDMDAARQALEQLIAMKPTDARPLEALLQLDLQQGSMNAAETHVRQLLNLDSRNSLGNYVMGVLHLRSGNRELAEDSLRVSIASNRSIAALNDLAWLLQETNRSEEAERIAREIIDKNPSLYQTWDTLGVILMRTGRLDEAVTAIEKSLSISQDDPSVFLHLAELQALRGDKNRAREILQVLYSKANELPESDREKMNELSRAMDAGTPPLQ